MNFSISVRSLFAIIAYVICFMASYFLLWDDQMRLTNFHIDPHQSTVTRFLVKHSSHNMNGEARLLGTILAFASIHLSWHFRYFVGDRLMAAYARRRQKSSTEQSVESSYFTGDSEPQMKVIQDNNSKPEDDSSPSR